MTEPRPKGQPEGIFSAMKELIAFLVQHGYLILFVWVLGERIGIPVPSAPLLLAAGAMAGEGLLKFPFVLSVAVLACLVSDTLWFLIGRYRGGSVLSLLCRITLTPDSCVRRAEDLFFRHGSGALVMAKFVPGLTNVAPALAGIFHMSFFRFLFFGGFGALLWVGSFAGLGVLFSDQIEQVADYAMRMGRSFGLVLGGSLAAFILWKYYQRRRFLRRLIMARITPEELKSRMDAGEDLMILDVRHPLEFEADPQTIPGALYLPLEQLQKEKRQVVPGDREIILFCN